MIQYDTGIAKLFRQYRKKHRLSLQELEMLTTITAPNLSRYEQGHAVPGWEVGWLIAYVLRIPLRKLVPVMPATIQQAEPDGETVLEKKVREIEEQAIASIRAVFNSCLDETTKRKLKTEAVETDSNGIEEDKP